MRGSAIALMLVAALAGAVLVHGEDAAPTTDRPRLLPDPHDDGRGHGAEARGPLAPARERRTGARGQAHHPVGLRRPPSRRQARIPRAARRPAPSPERSAAPRQRGAWRRVGTQRGRSSGGRRGLGNAEARGARRRAVHLPAHRPRRVRRRLEERADDQGCAVGAPPILHLPSGRQPTGEPANLIAPLKLEDGIYSGNYLAVAVAAAPFQLRRSKGRFA